MQTKSRFLPVLSCFLLVSCFIFSCSNFSKPQFSWLEGKWVQTNGEANFHEEWTRINDTLLTGEGYVLDSAKKIFSERLTISTIGENTIYRAELSTGRIADFTLTENSGDKLVFELPENDFPSKIIYSKKSENELLVVLEGLDNGKIIQEELIFARQK